MLKVALTKGRIEKKVTTMLEKLGYDVTSMINKNRELQINVEDKMEIIFAKSNDVVTFIEHGIVDIGIVGSDTLLENSFKNYYELLDLEIGKCSFAVCSYPEYKNIKLNRRKSLNCQGFQMLYKLHQTLDFLLGREIISADRFSCKKCRKK